MSPIDSRGQRGAPSSEISTAFRAAFVFVALLAASGVALALWLAGRVTSLAQGRGAAAAPAALPFQGRLLSPGGDAVPEGSASMLFSLYEAPTGGTAVWSSGPTAVEVKKGGMVNVLLGDPAHPLAEVDFSRALYVGVRIDDPANAMALEGEPELLPRVQVLPAPYAHGAGTARDAEALAGHNWSAILTGGSNDPSAAKIRGDRVDERYTVPEGAIIIWTRGPNCPPGYRRVGELDGRFLAGGAAYDPTAGGSNTHAHGAGSYAASSHTHQINYTGSTRGWNAGRGVSDTDDDAVPRVGLKPITSTPGGGEPIAGTSGPADSRPEFATVLLCECLERQ
ncbi:MAG: hypothetical protein HY721_29125 [Planctomycetes bacterium]|nr:hypothetical protein [Planctomycetota bacterium]